MVAIGERGRWPGWLLLLPLGLTGIVLAESLAPVMPACLFYRETGLLCPGCGATRAAVALSHGEILEALRDNLLLVTAVGPGALWVLAAGLRERFPQSPWLAPFRFRLAFLWFALATLVVFWVVRNLPGFGFLKPV